MEEGAATSASRLTRLELAPKKASGCLRWLLPLLLLLEEEAATWALPARGDVDQASASKSPPLTQQHHVARYTASYTEDLLLPGLVWVKGGMEEVEAEERGMAGVDQGSLLWLPLLWE